MIDCLSSFCLVKSIGFAHVVALGLGSMMLCYVIGKIVASIDFIRMHRTNCSGKTRIAWHVPGSSWAERHKNQCFYCYITLNAASATLCVPSFLFRCMTLWLCCVVYLCWYFASNGWLLWMLFIGFCCSHAAMPGWSNSLIVHTVWT